MSERKPMEGRALKRVLGSLALCASVVAGSALADSQASSIRTPIKHVIVVSGENRGFDNVFATYVPPDRRQKVWNLLSLGIVDANGAPGKNAWIATQKQATDEKAFQLSPPRSKLISLYLPQPSTTLNALPISPCELVTIANKYGKNPGGANFCEDIGLPASEQTRLSDGGTGQSLYVPASLAADALEARRAELSADPALFYPVPDCRYTADMPNGPFAIVGASKLDGKCVSFLDLKKPTPTKFTDNAGDPVHRFFQMWQQNDCSQRNISFANPSGCVHDLYTWVATSDGWGITKSGNAPTNDQQTFQGGVAMGFYSMAAGEYPYFQLLAQKYAMSDNYHQPVMGGTGANSQFMFTGDVYYYTDSKGDAAVPPLLLIENPDPKNGTNNWYTYANPGSKDLGNTSEGGLVNCSDLSQPGVAAIRNYLRSLPYRAFNNGNCEPGHYYQVDNEYPSYDHLGGPVMTGNEFSAGPAYSIGPQTIPTIGDALSARSISWKYYGEGFDVANNKSLANQYYCAICNGFQYARSIMTSSLKNNLQDLPVFYTDVKNRDFPAVSFIKPNILLDSHPGTSTPPLFEAFVKKIVDTVQQNPDIWKETAILITFDESGGYYDRAISSRSTFSAMARVQVMIAVSPFAKKGFVDHTYGDHGSILKFIERNWGLRPLSARSRDNLPNPVAFPWAPYFPLNSPAIGDLTEMFDFRVRY